MQQHRGSEIGSILQDPRLAVFFSNTLQIHALNSKLAKELSQRVQNWTPDTEFGDLFLHYGPLLKIFAQVCCLPCLLSADV